jgi:hypothetical protein
MHDRLAPGEARQEVEPGAEAVGLPDVDGRHAVDPLRGEAVDRDRRVAPFHHPAGLLGRNSGWTASATST